MRRRLPPGSITLLGVVLMALAPFVLVLAFRESLSWFGAALLFYAALGLAQVVYIGLLVAASRRARIGQERDLPRGAQTTRSAL